MVGQYPSTGGSLVGCLQWKKLKEPWMAIAYSNVGANHRLLLFTRRLNDYLIAPMSASPLSVSKHTPCTLPYSF